MYRRFRVPSEILGDQGVRVAELYRGDTEGNRETLASIGVTEEKIDEVERLGRMVLASDDAQETLKATTIVKKRASVEATKAICAWRSETVLTRVKLAFTGDPRLTYFRPGRIRSQRTAHVAREARLLVSAIRMFLDDPDLRARCVDEALAREGEALISAAQDADSEAANALAAQKLATQQLRMAEVTLDKMLSEIERCAASVFPPESAEQNRYRMNRIRNYLAYNGSRRTAEDEAVDETEKPAVSASDSEPEALLKAIDE